MNQVPWPIPRSWFALTIAFCVSGLLSVSHAGAQVFPVKPVKIIIGFAPSTTADVVTRIVATKMGEDLGQTVIVENRPGAAGTIATEAVARAPAPGAAPDSTRRWP